MAYSESVRSTITRNTSAAQGVSFNDVMIIGEQSVFTDTYRIYTNWTDFKADFTDDTTEIYKAARLAFSQGNVERLYVAGLDVEANTPTVFADVLLAEADWAILVPAGLSHATIKLLADEVEATKSGNMPKMMMATVSGDAVLDGTDTDVTAMLDAGYDQVVLSYHHEVNDAVAAAAFNGAYQAGSVSWKFLQLSGVETAKQADGKNLTSTQKGVLSDANINFMDKERGIEFWREGKTVSGEWIDVIRGVMWLNDRIETDLLTLLLNQRGRKLNFTTKDMQKITNTVDTILLLAVDYDILEGFIPSSVTPPSDVAFADKVSRIVDTLKWEGYLAGAVHEIVSNGNVTYASAELA